MLYEVSDRQSSSLVSSVERGIDVQMEEVDSGPKVIVDSDMYEDTDWQTSLPPSSLASSMIYQPEP